MKFRKTIFILVSALALTQTPASVLAHGHGGCHGGGHYSAVPTPDTSYEQAPSCHRAGCNITGSIMETRLTTGIPATA